MQSCEGAQKELKAPHSGVTEHSSNTPFVIEDNSGGIHGIQVKAVDRCIPVFLAISSMYQSSNC